MVQQHSLLTWFFFSDFNEPLNLDLHERISTCCTGYRRRFRSGLSFCTETTGGRICHQFVGDPSVPLDELKVEEWKSVMNINLTGVFFCKQDTFRIMIKQQLRGGHIIKKRVYFFAPTETEFCILLSQPSMQKHFDPFNLSWWKESLDHLWANRH